MHVLLVLQQRAVQRRDQLARVALAGTPLGFRYLGAAMLSGVASMLALIALASPAEILGLIAATVLTAAFYWGFARRNARSLSDSVS